MAYKYDLCGGHLALNLANTVSNRGRETETERVTDYADLVGFAQQSGLISAAESARLIKKAADDPAVRDAVLRRARKIREAIYRTFCAVVEKRAPEQADLDLLSHEAHHLHLGKNFEWKWEAHPSGLDIFLGDVVRSAVELLTSEDGRSRVNLCEHPTCVWLFFDGSKNRSRRWCDMKQCGNRVKVKRHYERSKH